MEAQNIVYDTCRDYIAEQSALPSEIKNTLTGWIRSRRFDLLAGCSTMLDPEIAGLAAVRALLQVEAFFSKNALFTSDFEARLAALISFEEAELLCEATNLRVDSFYDRDPSLTTGDYPIFNYIETMQMYIQRVLGPFSSFLDLLPGKVSITPGATATLSRKDAIPFLKVSKKMSCSPAAFPILELLCQFYGYGKFRGKLVTENRVEFVPKSWKTHRTIACEPTGNVPLQLAFDRFCKTRLRRVGINLADQTRNQELARIGSIDGSLSTIDIKQASDTVSYNVVTLLFPGDWLRYLQRLRSASYEMYPGLRTQYAKFSSMGNGSTFCIETLIFAAACKAVGSKRLSVYGDDIIIETELVPALLALLAYLGFTVNTDKSFSSGPLRESCGATWYRGCNITPKYIRCMDKRKPILCHFVNNVVAIAQPKGPLINRCITIIRDARLPLVPFCEDSLCGVWIDSDTALSLGVVTTTKVKRKFPKTEYRIDPILGLRRVSPIVDQYIPYIRRFKGYIPKNDEVLVCFDSRALFLWHLKATGGWVKGSSGSFLFQKKLGHETRRTTRSQKKAIEKWLSPHVIADDSVGRYTVSSQQYDKKWIHWYPVVSGAPDHLVWWSESISSLISDGDLSVLR